MAWPHGTDPITYVYALTDADGVEHEIAVTRRHVGTAYARNGNVGNATEYFVWSSTADGKPVMSSVESRAVGYEYARAEILGIDYHMPRYYQGRPNSTAVNVRGFHTVQAEMKANYRSRRVPQEV